MRRGEACHRGFGLDPSVPTLQVRAEAGHYRHGPVRLRSLLLLRQHDAPIHYLRLVPHPRDKVGPSREHGPPVRCCIFTASSTCAFVQTDQQQSYPTNCMFIACPTYGFLRHILHIPRMSNMHFFGPVRSTRGFMRHIARSS